MARQRKQGTRQSGGKSAAETKQRRAPKGGGNAERILNENVERLTGVVGKGIELAEAGLAIGARLLGTLGKTGADSMLSRVMDAASGALNQQTPPVNPQTGTDVPQSAQPATAWVMNRMPLRAGSEVRVSFSMNNDSGDSPRMIKLRVGMLVGERSGGRLPEGVLAVSPSEAELAPLDFEKFVLVGRLPEDMLPDAYVGAVAIEGADSFSIPVRLTVV